MTSRFAFLQIAKNAVTRREVTLNCFFMNMQTDHLPTIFSFKKNIHDEYCSHAVLSHRVQVKANIAILCSVYTSSKH